MLVKDATGLGSESDKNVAKKKSLTIQKKKDDATVAVNIAEKPAPQTKAAAK